MKTINEIIQDLEILILHNEDDSYEIDFINNFTNTYAISCFHENLEEAILKYISEGVIF